MRTSTWSAPRRHSTRASGFAAFTLMLAACGDIPSVPGSPTPLRDGDVVDVQGAAELTVHSAGSATPTRHLSAPWRVSGNVQRGVATMDFQQRGLAARDPARDRDGTADDAEARMLGQLAPALLGPLAINEDSRMAGFGLKSVVQQTIPDGSGGAMQLYAISDFKRGPLTDMLLVRDGKVLGYQKVSWVRERGVWKAAGARFIAKTRDGTTTTATVRVAGMLAESESDTTSWASMAARGDEIQFAALAKRLVLPATAGAQAWSPGSIDCSLYRNSLAPSSSPCLAYAFNKAGAPLAAIFGFLAGNLKQFSPEAIQGLAASRGLGAVVALLEGAGEAVVAAAGSTWVYLGVSALLLYTGFALAECMASHAPAIQQCNPGNPGIGGVGPSMSGGAGSGSDVCDALCDAQVRAIVDEMRAAMSAAAEQ